MSEQRKPTEKRRRWTAKAKMEVVLEGFKGEESIAELCRRHGITQSMYYEWQETMLQAGLEGLTHGGKSSREAELEKQLKQAQSAIGRLTMENELYQKKRSGSLHGGRSRNVLSAEGQPVSDRPRMSRDGCIKKCLL